MLHHFIKNPFFLSLIVGGFLVYFPVNGSIGDVLADEKKLLRKGLFEAQEELRTALDPYHKEFLKDHIRGLRALLNVFPVDDRQMARQLPLPPVGHLPPHDLHYSLNGLMVLHQGRRFTVFDRRSRGSAPHLDSGGNEGFSGANRIALSYVRNRAYAGIHSASSREEEGGEQQPLQPDGESGVFTE